MSSTHICVHLGQCAKRKYLIVFARLEALENAQISIIWQLVKKKKSIVRARGLTVLSVVS